MDFSPSTPPRRTSENIVPMINVVFLLLIFFLMSAQIAPPDPFEVSPPASQADTPPDAPGTLYVSARGGLSFDGMTGEAAITAAAHSGSESALILRVDANLPAADLAALVTRLRSAGAGDLALVTAMAPEGN